MLYEIFTKNPIICTDSRKIVPGCMFFALKGESFDGNRYAQRAIELGAAYSVVDDPNLVGERLIVVDDVLRALQALAGEHRRALGIPIIALTGSNGKTTTKELLARVLGTKYRVGATVGNLNNHIGVPLTLLSFDSQTEIGIVEMGANHQGEIELLCSIAQPNVGLITNIGRAHLEGFGGGDGVRRGKGELYDYLSRTGGVAVYNSADQILSEMIAQRTAVGYDPAAEPLELSIYGDYNQLNAQAAYALGLHFGVDPRSARLAIRDYIPQNNRSQVVQSGSNTLYLDAYNANPSSMRAALEHFAALDVPNKVAILGEMRELGEYSPAEHASVVALARQGQFERLILVGPNFEPCRESFEHFDSSAQLAEHLAKNPVAEKHILIKGSRGVALETIIENLRK